MKSTLPMPGFFRSMTQLRKKQGLKTTLLGIGPMSERIAKVSLELANERQFPIMFIASRNQVDLRELGGGYVNSWDQAAFADAIRGIAARACFEGVYYLCRDHGGPWQRDDERKAKLSAQRAMEIAKRSYLEDLLQGFDLLHIDPTRDPHAEEHIWMDTVLHRTVELIEFVEHERRARHLPEICYEVGSEETSGGLTSPDIYDSFIRNLNHLLSQKGLPRPVFIVGQTGTLTRMTENIGRFDGGAAVALSLVSSKHDAGLKEHNADYLADKFLLQHPLLGITAANVAPEFGVEETTAYLQLAAVEEEGHRRGEIASTSHLLDIFSRKAVSTERWRKWMTGINTTIPLKEALENAQLRTQITLISGHYVFDDPEVRGSLEQMCENLSRVGIDPDRYVNYRIRQAIDRYVHCFNLEDLTPKVTWQYECLQ